MRSNHRIAPSRSDNLYVLMVKTIKINTSDPPPKGRALREFGFHQAHTHKQQIDDMCGIESRMNDDVKK